MIYFIVNNNYQYFDFQLHLKSLPSEDVALVEIPHTLEKYEHQGLKKVYRYELDFSHGTWARLKSYISSKKRILQEIKPSKNDICFFYTEYEVLNQVVVEQFKKAQSKVYIIEDGGMGTYALFRRAESEKLTLKEQINLFIMKMVSGLFHLRSQKINNQIFPWMPDKDIDAVCVYQPVKIKRNIPVKHIGRPEESQIETNPGLVIFLNEDIYNFYQTDEEYIKGLKIILSNLVKGFEKVLFKYHPRENAVWRDRIKSEVLDQLNIKVLEENAGVEQIITKYAPYATASYFSSGLMNLSYRGIEPLYLYHMLPDLVNQPVCVETTSILNDLGYHFISSWTEANTHFKSNLLKSSRAKRETTQLYDLCHGSKLN